MAAAHSMDAAQEHSTLPGSVRRRPHVLFVNTRSQLGADVAVHLSIIRHLDPERCQVSLATNRAAEDVDETLRAVEGVKGLRVLLMTMGWEAAYLPPLKRRYLQAAGVLAMGWSLVRLACYVLARGVNVIHSTDRPRDVLLSTVLARLTRRPNVLHMHIKYGPELGRVTEWGVAKATAIIAISDFVKASVVECGFAAEKVHVVHNATDTERFSPERVSPGALRGALGLSADVPLLGIVARLIYWKGHLDLVEALALVRRRIPQAHLAIIGRLDPYSAAFADNVRQKVCELGLEDAVHWVGWSSDPPGVFADLDVVCVPSHEEPFGLVVTEAMAMRRPVVSCRSGAIPEIVEDGVDGVLVPPRDPRALAEAIIGLLEDPERSRRMGEAARRKVTERFTPAAQAEGVVKLYERLVGLRA